MKRRRPIIFIVFALSLMACTKSSSNTNKVFIRIANTTAEKFTSFTLNAIEFGGIPSGDTSNYFLCKDVYSYPFANSIVINNIIPTLIVDIAPTPYMTNGNYLMKVESDTYRYRATFIKE